MERSVEMLVGILGVMKAGAAYVPLDPGFPLARNEQILEETRVPVLLTLKRHLNSLPESDAQTLCLDNEWTEWGPPSADVGEMDGLPEIAPQMRAYVIFTSGSTGRPKGVEVTHGAVVNLLTSAVELIGAGVSDRLVAVTTLAFDISVLELFLPLVCGGTVVIANKDDASDALRLKDLLKSSRATMLQATPVTFRSLLELGFEAPAGFKMMCGGEAWAPAMAERLLSTGGRLWNMYGPTETTVWSSIVEVKRAADKVTFGPPIAKTRFYVMDAERNPVSPGKQGELCGELWIAGAGVARGYFHREELTAERFFADPFVPGGRMYRTGDEVRQLDDGTIEFVGRLDQQVKLRGFRVELGEIEAAMLTVSGVREAVAMLRKDVEGEDFLAVVYAADAHVTDESLRLVLVRQLPGYMVPKVMARLESLPLTPNGKTDRRALAGIEFPHGDGERLVKTSEKSEQVVEAQNGKAQNVETGDIERRMLGIWQKLFPRVAISESSNFFDLGGDSLLMVRLQSRTAHEFNLRLTIVDVTTHCTFSGMVGWVRHSMLSSDHLGETVETDPAVLPLQTTGEGVPIFIIPQMLIFRTLAGELGPEQPFYGLQFPDDQVAEQLSTASFEDLASLYCRQIQNLQPKGPYRLGGWCLWGWMAYEVARQLEAKGEEVEMLAIIDAWAPGYWKRYSPLRQSLVNASHFWQRILWYLDSMNGLPAREQMADVARRLREVFIAALNVLPRRLRPPLEQVEMLRIQRFASKAAESYRPGPIKGKVVLFKSELRPTGTFLGEDMGWSAIAGRQLRLDALPGNHNEIFHPAAARIMGARMREVLGLPPVGGIGTPHKR